MIDLRYSYNDQPVAEGERAMIYQGGRLYVRTGLKGNTADEITYRLREVYVAAASVTLPPVAGVAVLHAEVP